MSAAGTRGGLDGGPGAHRRDAVWGLRLLVAGVVGALLVEVGPFALIAGGLVLLRRLPDRGGSRRPLTVALGCALAGFVLELSGWLLGSAGALAPGAEPYVALGLAFGVVSAGFVHQLAVGLQRWFADADVDDDADVDGDVVEYDGADVEHWWARTVDERVLARAAQRGARRRGRDPRGA